MGLKVHGINGYDLFINKYFVFLKCIYIEESLCTYSRENDPVTIPLIKFQKYFVSVFLL